MKKSFGWVAWGLLVGSGCDAPSVEPLPAEIEQSLLEETRARADAGGTDDTGAPTDDLMAACFPSGGGGYCCGIEWGGEVYFCCVVGDDGACG